MSSDVDKHLNGIGISHINPKGLLPTDRQLSDLPKQINKSSVKLKLDSVDPVLKEGKFIN